MRPPSIVPHDAERDTYLVLDDFGGHCHQQQATTDLVRLHLTRVSDATRRDRRSSD
jgi:hypothetical protein